MHGNVAEWCQDVYRDSYEGATADGSAWVAEDPGNRVFRGGSWEDNDWYTRSAARDGNPPDRSFGRIGFRVARIVASD
jgi:formylglycine-generating enzyme required for sulfatase activity